MDLELRDKVAVITGGSRGIGKAIARELLIEGAMVAICSRNEEEIQAAAADLRNETGGVVEGIKADTSNRDAIENLVVRTVDRFGRLDIVVNNAARLGGTGGPEDLAHVTDEMILGDFETKVLGYIRLIRAAVPHMEKNGWGRIVNIGGMSARMPSGTSTGMRNAAIVNATKSIANEVGGKGINAVTIHPGLTVTERQTASFESTAKSRGISSEEFQQGIAQNIAIRHIVTAEELAHVVAFFCSPKSLPVTGEVIGASGGGGPAAFY
jgi:NAD(P)-dependent dehydrogenase (short-subunit alcohol dehydrogenase family)